MNVNTFLDYYPRWVVGWVGGLTLTIKLISAQLNYAAAGAGLSLARLNHKINPMERACLTRDHRLPLIRKQVYDNRKVLAKQ